MIHKLSSCEHEAQLFSIHDTKTKHAPLQCFWLIIMHCLLLLKFNEDKIKEEEKKVTMKLFVHWFILKKKRRK